MSWDYLVSELDYGERAALKSKSFGLVQEHFSYEGWNHLLFTIGLKYEGALQQKYHKKICYEEFPFLICFSLLPTMNLSVWD